ncbi:GNAT family N-acetyltransferase [Streptomyces sp. OUCMDZ-4982]|uniref:GNAT family N-acetyltransferase n=1 Tax=Streptomyces sp. OUCMDZ-4982 TaxID=2973090 RepID=UPI00215CDF7D|nr:GNAT family N-acetyltransferase [Streptomyces sp. OUCMDZ-4982]MCR8945149.1 GNAT family N-acetyltransferase [Streptomyces sp. OUCMDZ-4982]
MHPISRHSQRLHLRELRPEDTDGVYAIYGDARATEHLSFDPRTRDDVAAIVARSIDSATVDPRQEYALAVTDIHGGQLIGFGRLALDPHQPRAATFGFALRPDTWGHGYGTETVRLLLACAFEDLALHRVWGARSPLNTASARTMERAGLSEEGYIREHVQRGEKWRDSVTHSILEREYSPMGC